MSQQLPRIAPSESLQAADENIAVNETTYQFYREVKARSEFKRYCQWYYSTARSNREELEKMRGELNIFQWFRRQS